MTKLFSFQRQIACSAKSAFLSIFRGINADISKGEVAGCYFMTHKSNKRNSKIELHRNVANAAANLSIFL